MTDKSDDPIIDACLEEVLAGRRPPDLTARILQAWEDAEATRAVASSAPPWRLGTHATSLVEPIVSQEVSTPKPVDSSRRDASPWLAVAVSLSIIAVGSAFVWIAWDATELKNQPEAELAGLEQALPHAPENSSNPQPKRISNIPPKANVAPPPMTVEPQSGPDSSIVVGPSDVPKVLGSPPEISVPDERPAPLAEEQLVREINELIQDRWRSEGATPAGVVTDRQWCRRVHMKLIGREPRAGELSSFVSSRSANKRESLVALLLKGETYIEEFAAYWSQTWADILISSGNNRSDRDGLEHYLRRAFGSGKPFDQTTCELLTATGSGKIGSNEYNGATNFLLAHADAEGVHAQVTSSVSRTFMAHAFDCSQCHNDDIWSGSKQHQFWQLSAFFRQMEMKRDSDGVLVIADTDRVRHDRFSDEGGVYYTLVNGLMKHANPVFLDGTEIPRTPSVTQISRRELLAKFVTRSEQFRQAIVNRFWAELFGVGFTIPADNIGPHNPPSHPRLLATLGDQFAAHDYDVRALIRWIVLSEPFALLPGDVATHDQIGAKIVFDRFPESMEDREPLRNQLKLAQEAYASVKRGFGSGATPARVTPTEDPGAVPAELSDIDKLLATVHIEARRLSKSTVYGNYILDSEMSLDQKIQHMFFATLHRAPTASEEKAVANVLASSTSTSDESALEYIWWALASSQEAR